MKTMFKLFVFMLVAALAFSFTSCAKDGGNGDGGDGGNNVTPPSDTENNGTDDDAKLRLVENGVANFSNVTTNVMSGSTVKAAQEFAKKLRSAGVSVEDPIRDTKANAEQECEIIIGYGLTNRDEKYVLDYHDYGPNGYAIKIVDKKILIIGGDAEMTNSALDYFITKVMKLTGKNDEITDFSIEKTFERVKNTEYLITSVEIAGNSLKDYVYVMDVDGMDKSFLGFLSELTDEIYVASGIYIKTVTASEAADTDKKIVVRYTDNAGEDGFRAYVDSSESLIFECAYANAFSQCVEHIIKTKILDKIGAASIAKNYNQSYHVATVKYSQFGAVGDGKTDDFEAIYNTHVFANQSGQKVLGDKDASYYIHYFNKTVPVKTDVDFSGATFVIDDVGSDIYAVKGINLFTVEKDSKTVVLTRTDIVKDPNIANATLKQYDTEIPWLVPYLDGKKCHVYLLNNHKDYVRWGGNLTEGQQRCDVVIINPDGTLDADTPIIWDFEPGSQYINNGLKKYEITTENFERIEITAVDDRPITIENGYFIRTVCKTVAETGFENESQYYSRGFNISRSNVTMKNITHRLLGEPEILPSVTVYPGSMYGHDAEGKLKHSYPYGGFFVISKVYNFNAEDCPLTAHTLYWAQKATQSAPVGMGTYDINVYGSSHISFKGITNGVDHCDSLYWGIMCSNSCKNFYFTDCVMNRFDAHEGFWNATLLDSEFGYTLNVIGGGKLYIENCVRNTGSSFITLRADYGSTFNGTLHIVNSRLEGLKIYKGQNHPDKGIYYTEDEEMYVVYAPYYDTYNTNDYISSEATSFPYLKWDFGYTCYMPQNIIIDNLTVGEGATAPLYLFNDVGDAAFVKPNNFEQSVDDLEHLYYNQYQIPKSIKYKNMQNNISICPKQSSHLYNALTPIIEYD